MTTRDRLLQLLQQQPRTPVELLQHLEAEPSPPRDGGVVLLQLMASGEVTFGVDGLVRPSTTARPQETCSVEA